MEARSRNLSDAKRVRNDEFYTLLTDIEKELVHYHDQLRDKVIFCNCDDPEQSNFWKYFDLNFDHIGIKALIATHYDLEKPTYKLEIRRDEMTGMKLSPVRTDLRQNGDFRSDECVELLKQCDVVVTNPPFSIVREYVAQLMDSGKQFLIISSMNSITCKEIFPLLRQNRMWIGYTNPKQFLQPDGSLKSFGNILWYTNIEIAKRHEPLMLFRRYADDPSRYLRYDNYDAIEVSRVQDIPEDYFGVMGVPITFLDKYCPEQFEILGLSRKDGFGLQSTKCYDTYREMRPDGMATGATGRKMVGNPVIAGMPSRGNYYSDGVHCAYSLYGRIFIRRR